MKGYCDISDDVLRFALLFQNNPVVKGDILATINCDSEALDKFMRGINELPQWTYGGCSREHQNALQDENRLKEFLDHLHLTEYFEVFRVFSHCNEWWSKLPLFTDEEMQVWFGMDKPGHVIRFRLALKENFSEDEDLEAPAALPIAGDRVKFQNRSDIGLPVDLAKSRSRGEDEILVLFKGNLVSLRISAQDIRIASRSATESSVDLMHTHKLAELMCVYQDGEDLTKFGYQLVDTSSWEFQTASIVTSARAILIIAHRFGF